MYISEIADELEITENELAYFVRSNKIVPYEESFPSYKMKIDSKYKSVVIDRWNETPSAKAKAKLEKEKAEQALLDKMQREKTMQELERIIVTTGDLQQEYEVLGPVYFQVSNKGLFGSALDKLKQKYSEEIRQMRNSGSMSRANADWGFLYGEWSVGQNDFEAAFYIATQELKKRATIVGADAVICMRQDIDLDTNGFAYFYLQMYGTAVKLK